MSRFQKLSLLIGVLILVAVIALVFVEGANRQTQTVIPITQTVPLAAGDMTNTRIAVIYETAIHEMTATQLVVTPTS